MRADYRETPNCVLLRPTVLFSQMMTEAPKQQQDQSCGANRDHHETSSPLVNSSNQPVGGPLAQPGPRQPFGTRTQRPPSPAAVPSATGAAAAAPARAGSALCPLSFGSSGAPAPAPASLARPALYAARLSPSPPSDPSPPSSPAPAAPLPPCPLSPSVAAPRRSRRLGLAVGFALALV